MTDMGATFRALHQPGKPFILMNVWDVGTARMMAGLGAQALATSSAAHAYVMGRGDGGTVTRDEALAHAEEIVMATDLPVQGDFENGFGDDPETCAETVRLAASVGLAGICIEDTRFPQEDSYEFDDAVERIRAAASAARALPADFVLTARADGILAGTYDADEAIRRLQAFEAAGADCLYAPLPASLDDLKRIIAAVKAPSNVLWAGSHAKIPLAELAQMGAARVSLGSSLARVAQRVMHDAAVEMLQDGRGDALTRGIGSGTVDALMAEGSRQT